MLFASFSSFAYYTLKIFMNICKYLLFLMVFWLAALFFMHSLNSLYIENIFWIERDKPLYMWWTIARVLMNVALISSISLSLIWSIVVIVRENIYLEWRKYILWIFLYGIFWILLLPYVVVMENKESKYRWFRLTFYFYTMLFIVNFSWFISWILSDLWTIALETYRGTITSI